MQVVQELRKNGRQVSSVQWAGGKSSAEKQRGKGKVNLRGQGPSLNSVWASRMTLLGQLWWVVAVGRISLYKLCNLIRTLKGRVLWLISPVCSGHRMVVTVPSCSRRGDQAVPIKHPGSGLGTCQRCFSYKRPEARWKSQDKKSEQKQGICLYHLESKPETSEPWRSKQRCTSEVLIFKSLLIVWKPEKW